MWHCLHLPLHAVMQRSCCWVPDSNQSISPACQAHSSKPAARHVAPVAGEWDRQTDGQTQYHYIDPAVHTMWAVSINEFKHLLVCSYSTSKDLYFYLCHFFVYFFSLLARISQNQWMDGSWVFYEQLGVWCDWIRYLVPLFSGRWGNCPKFSPKFDGALIWWVVITKRLKMCKRKHSFKRGITALALHFGQKYTSLPLPIFEKSWRTRCTSFI